MLKEIVMEHNPLLSFEDGLEVTYSNLKKHEDARYSLQYTLRDQMQKVFSIPHKSTIPVLTLRL